MNYFLPALRRYVNFLLAVVEKKREKVHGNTQKTNRIEAWRSLKIVCVTQDTAGLHQESGSTHYQLSSNKKKVCVYVWHKKMSNGSKYNQTFVFCLASCVQASNSLAPLN